MVYKQHCIYMFRGVPCHVINLYQSKLLANKFNENKNCPVILAFVCSKIVFCRTFSSFCTASWILIERWEWIKNMFCSCVYGSLFKSRNCEQTQLTVEPGEKTMCNGVERSPCRLYSSTKSNECTHLNHIILWIESGLSARDRR